MKGKYLLVNGVCTIIGLHVVFYGKFVRLFVIVSEAGVVVVKVGIYLVLLQQICYLLIIIL